MKTAAQQNRNGLVSGGPSASVLVSGASFAGLATAWWLNHLGYTVTVVEIASGLRKGGTPVNIREGVIEVVRRMNLLDRITAASLPPRPVAFLDPQGVPLRLQSAEPEPEEEYEIERDVLLEMLFSEVEGRVEFLFGDSIAGLKQSDAEVAVTFISGAQRCFSLVLGCDGTHSAVRKLCFGEESRFLVFLKNYFSLTIVDKLLLAENTSQMFSVPGRTIMLNAYNGKTDIAFCFSSEAEISYDRRKPDEAKRLIREHFAGGRLENPRAAWRDDPLRRFLLR